MTTATMNPTTKPTGARSIARPLPRPLLLSLRGLVLAGAAMLAGCSILPKPQADPTRYYVLTGPSIENAAAAVAASETAPATGKLRVGVQTVRIAPYLDGKAMIVRRGENEIDYRDFARWAEPLTTGVGRMLGARLLTSGQVARVYHQPFPFDVERDVDVMVSVLRAEGVLKTDGTAAVSFVCAVEVTDARPDGAVRLRRVFRAPEVAWTDGDYPALALALSEAVALLSTEVLAALPAQ